MRRPALIAIAAFGAAVAVFVANHHHCLYDDAFIYLRYVRNIHAGCGLRWNCGDDAVEGFSSPLYLALLALGSIVTTKLVLVTTIVSTAALFAAGAMAILATTDGGRPALRALAVAALLGADHLVLINGVIGMDSALAAAMIVACTLAIDRARWKLVLVLGAVGLLARPEMVLYAACLPLIVPRAHRRRAIATVIASVMAVALVRWLVFHDIAPNTYWAKRGGTATHALLGLEYLRLFVVDFPFVVLAPLALLDRAHRRSTWFVLAGSVLWCATFLQTGGDTFPYSRLAFALVPALAVLAIRGAFTLARRRREWLGVVPFAFMALRAGWQHHVPAQHSFENVSAWIAVGRYLETHHRGQTLATVPIGAIGYTSKLPLLDLVGLTDRTTAKAGRSVPPDLLSRQWIGHERHDLERFAEVLPDIVVTTKYRAEPWTTLDEASTGFYADWLVLRAIKDGSLPYRVADAEVAPGVHWLLFERIR